MRRPRVWAPLLCVTRSRTADPDFKDQDVFFPNVTRRMANSMSSSRRIYNPSLGFFALRLAAHM